MSYRLATTDTKAPSARLLDDPLLLLDRPLAPTRHAPSLTIPPRPLVVHSPWWTPSRQDASLYPPRLPRTGGPDRTVTVYLVVVLDWQTKKVVGHYAGMQARAWHSLVALNRAVNRQFPGGSEGQTLNLMADNGGCQPTSLAFMRACAAMRIRHALTSYSTPPGATPIPSASCEP